MKAFLVIAGVMVLIISAWLLMRTDSRVIDTGAINHWFKKNASAYKESILALKQSISRIDIDSTTVLEAREALLTCRLKYKRLAFFIEFYFPDQAMIFNGPPVIEVERGMSEYRDPAGMQVIEGYLFESNPAKLKDKMLEQTGVLERSINNLLSSLDNFTISADDAWYALSLEWIRVYTLYITGYDAPQLKSGLAEAASSLEAMDTVLYFLNAHAVKNINLLNARKYLLAHNNFDSFDRLYFISTFAIPLQKQFNSRIQKEPGNLTSRSTVNFNATSIFAADGINKNYFSSEENMHYKELASLGQRLFSEPMLSGNNQRSCSTCHAPATFFSDRLRRNKNRELTGDLPRNTPSLLYAVYQSNQFWDGRVRTLAQQAIAVMNDTLEMKGSGQAIAEKISNDPSYNALFKKIWKEDTVITENHIAAALAAYVQTLTPFRSSFDSYIAGNKSALTEDQKRGFNIYMGKALCGTCHFAPLFNGLLPPLYKVTEFEILGTPLDDDLQHPKPDTDTGRARTIQSLPQGSFKTPTVRNASKTAPYMHNGGFKTMEAVIDFYDKGGGQGLGLDIPGQTLSPKPLKLSATEKTDLAAFIIALTDN